MQIAVALFDRVTVLDAIGPYEVLQRLPEATVTFVGEKLGEVRSDNGFLGLTVDATYDDIPTPDVIVVPGGVGTRQLMDPNPIHDWLRSAHETTQFTTSVCTGSIVLAAAGLLQGMEATTHWSAYEELNGQGAIATGKRVVEHLDERIITAAGVSSGIDMALRLSELLVDDIAAKAMQLMIEYDPQPPFDCGAIEKSDDVVMARVIEYAATKS